MGATDRAGDPVGESPADEFGDFYAHETDWARRLAYTLVADREAAEDIAQESFLRLQGRYDSLENPRAYLRVVIVNAARRHWRSESRRHDAQTTSPLDATISPPAHEILDLIDHLPNRQRAVVVLRYFEGLNEAEIASTLRCRPGTVKSLAARALERLRKELEA